MKTGECHVMSKDLIATDLDNRKYGVAKMSGDHSHEVYLFQTKEECEAYGSSYDANKEVLFIRAPGELECYVCEHCGTAKSVKFLPYEEQVDIEDIGGTGNNISSSYVLSLLSMLAVFLL